MKYQLLSLFAFIVFSGFAQDKPSKGTEKYTISGYVKDAKNGESLIGATVYKQGSNIGASANEYGFYALTLPKGEHIIAVGLIGYATFTFAIDLDKSVTKNFELKEEGKDLEEVEITSEAADKNVKSVEMSVAKLDIKQINKIPALLGEVDVIRAIQLLPGVTTVGEGASGFNVRGGNIDQNLILLDEAPVYNSSHLFGFFSVFNPDAVKDVKLIKGGIPSQYGGRVSSILDVRMKEGNSKKTTVSGGLGTIFSRISLEAPIIKDKASFIIAGRRSYIDALVKPFLKETNALKKADFYFYDLTAKFNWRINDKNTVFASGYLGRDVFGASVFSFNWGNTTTTARWNHIFNKKLFMNATAFYSNYDYALKFGTSSGQSFNWKSNIINYSLKNDFIYYLNSRNTLRFGAQALAYDFLPYNAVGNFENATVTFKSAKRYGVEYSTYIGNEQKITPKITAEYGVRFSMYTYVGKGKAYYFRDTVPNTARALDRSATYNAGQLIKAYINPEPRFSMNYSINKVSSLKFSYNRMAQYIQLISNTAASTPLDVYTIASNNLKPLLSDQGSVGYFRNFKDNMFETSVECYYKYLQNQLDYIDNADLFINPTVENQLLQGLGRAYGAEFYVKKNKGKLQGWISYTLSKTERLVRGISNGDWFKSRYDRTHSLNTSLNYDITKRWNISANFVLLSGVPATFPNAKVQVQGWSIPYNTDNVRNNFRITSYHRLDLGATYDINMEKVWARKKDRRVWYRKVLGLDTSNVMVPRKIFKNYKSSLVFSVYNAYNRRNAFSIYFRTKEGTTYQTEAVRFSIVGSVIPAVTYNFNF
ncbi:MAG: TonB-dependent receptor [Bacteroidia bacterium]|nr:TonB-dependent receptor [Bacteroidia bacterium]